MAKVKVQRTREFMNLFRNYTIFIDGQKVGTIGNGQLIQWETSPGQHKISAKIDWCSSQEITFATEENVSKTFTVGGFKNAGFLFVAFASTMALHFLLNYFFGFKYLIIFSFPLLFFIALFTNFGGEKYLNLIEL
jgi:hypothetical protein